MQNDSMLFNKQRLIDQLQNGRAEVVLPKSRVLQCTHCPYACLSSHKLVRHYIEEHDQNTWCYNCFVGITDAQYFEEHLVQHCQHEHAIVYVTDVKRKDCGCKYKHKITVNPPHEDNNIQVDENLPDKILVSMESSFASCDS